MVRYVFRILMIFANYDSNIYFLTAKLTNKVRRIKERYLSAELKYLSIYQIKAEVIKLVDYTEENEEQIIRVSLNMNK